MFRATVLLFGAVLQCSAAARHLAANADTTKSTHASHIDPIIPAPTDPRHVKDSVSSGVAGTFSNVSIITQCLGEGAVHAAHPDTVGQALHRRRLQQEPPFSLTATAPHARYDPGVEVTLSPPLNATDTQAVGPGQWGLDRIDQRGPLLDGRFQPAAGSGQGVIIYSLDTGVMTGHQEFRAAADGAPSRAESGWDFVGDDANAADCDGHGTHVASIAIGLGVGVAKAARLVSLRMLDCNGSGSVADTVAALDWVAKRASKPAVVLLSLGIPAGTWSTILEQAVRSLVVDVGLSVVVASGNGMGDACDVAPANVPETITVAASDMQHKFSRGDGPTQDTLYDYSNTGPCVDLFAPGVDIYGACGGVGLCNSPNASSYAWLSGTSMAVPLVVGAAALFLERNPEASPAEVKAALLDTATQGQLSGVAGMRAGTADRLLFVGRGSVAMTVQAAGGG